MRISKTKGVGSGELIAQQTELTGSTIQVWFSNRRARFRNTNKNLFEGGGGAGGDGIFFNGAATGMGASQCLNAVSAPIPKDQRLLAAGGGGPLAATASTSIGGSGGAVASTDFPFPGHSSLTSAFTAIASQSQPPMPILPMHMLNQFLAAALSQQLQQNFSMLQVHFFLLK